MKIFLVDTTLTTSQQPAPEDQDEPEFEEVADGSVIGRISFNP